MRRFVPPQVAGFLDREDGPTAVEYAVMMALIIVVCVGSLTALGSNSNKSFTKAATAAAKKTNSR